MAKFGRGYLQLTLIMCKILSEIKQNDLIT